jgi:hypothetical protein
MSFILIQKKPVIHVVKLNDLKLNYLFKKMKMLYLNQIKPSNKVLQHLKIYQIEFLNDQIVIVMINKANVVDKYQF